MQVSGEFPKEEQGEVEDKIEALAAHRDCLLSSLLDLLGDQDFQVRDGAVKVLGHVQVETESVGAGAPTQ